MWRCKLFSICKGDFFSVQPPWCCLWMPWKPKCQLNWRHFENCQNFVFPWRKESIGYVSVHFTMHVLSTCNNHPPGTLRSQPRFPCVYPTLFPQIRRGLRERHKWAQAAGKNTNILVFQFLDWAILCLTKELCFCKRSLRLIKSKHKSNIFALGSICAQRKPSNVNRCICS